MQDGLAEKSKDFYNGIAHAVWQFNESDLYHMGVFDAQHTSLHAAQQNLVTELISPLNITHNQKVLDIGCGSGAVALAIAAQYQANVTGISIAKQQIDLANRKISSSNIAGVDFQLMDAHQLDFAKESFDHAYAMESLLHMDRAKVFAKLFPMLKPGAKFTLCDWYVKKELNHEEAAFTQSMISSTYVSIDAYKQLLEQAGFTVLSFVDWTEQSDATYQCWNTLSDQQQQQLPTDLQQSYIENSTKLTNIVRSKLGYGMLLATKR